MLEVKKKTDRFFLKYVLVLLVVIFLVSLFVEKVNFVFLAVPMVLGFLAGSLVQYKDSKSYDDETYEKKVVFNLALNLVVYGLFFYTSMYFFDVFGVVICAVTLIMYRSLFFKNFNNK